MCVRTSTDTLFFSRQKMSSDAEEMKKQTLLWMENYSRSKLNMKKMVMVITNGIPRFVPRHLL